MPTIFFTLLIASVGCDVNDTTTEGHLHLYKNEYKIFNNIFFIYILLRLHCFQNVCFNDPCKLYGSRVEQHNLNIIGKKTEKKSEKKKIQINDSFNI